MAEIDPCIECANVVRPRQEATSYKLHNGIQNQQYGTCVTFGVYTVCALMVVSVRHSGLL